MRDTRDGTMPTRIGRYHVVDRIGRGAMGIVYSAQDEVIGRPVALKVLMADLERDPETRARFSREAQAAARLLHPNIITIFDAGEDKGRSFIAMQLLEGAPLAAYLDRPDAASLERKLDLMIQMCEGLAAAHGQGIVHRDLKPSNLFVQSDGLLKILDFGLARFVDSSMTAAGTMLGTPDYMSPEQARGSPVDARSDIFSAGAVFYFILAGRKPFPGPDIPAVLHQLQFEEPPPLGGRVPRELETLVLHAMAKNADERPSRTEDLLATLVRFRRRYQSETRKLVMTARAHFDEAGGVVAAIGDARTRLGLPGDESAAALQQLQQRCPPLASRISTADAVAFERGRVTGVLVELIAERDRLNQLLATYHSQLSQLESGERALAAGDARAALRCFEAVEAAWPDGSRARELADSARPLVLEQEKREEQVAVHIASARRALDGREWTTAVAECRQALALAPGHAPASSLLAEAEQSIGREQRRIALVTQRLIERASRALDDRELDLAEAALKEADSIAPGTAAVRDLRHRLAEARAAAEAAELLHQLSVEEIRRARSMFRRGRYDEAVQQLRGFLEVEPDAQEVGSELERLIALREAMASTAATARRQATDCVAQANALADAGELASALGLAREAVRLDPTEGEAAALIDRLLTRELEERVAHERNRNLEERTRDVVPLLEAARLARERGFVAIALQAALAAQRILPGRADIATLAEDIRGELTSEDHETFELAAPAITPQPPAPAPSPAPASEAVSAPVSADNGVLNWAADLLRSSLRRGKA
jgi:tRNA A-37 threonylcarbamoyl transferase component Bud32/tetratricopeptide (TPR) repeat protein